MAYFVFDLDETLGRFEVVGDLLEILDPETHSDQPPFQDAYDRFVRSCAKEEASLVPIGIFRPGIFGIMKQLAALKRAGKIKGCLIYSNNRHLPTLQFAADVIHAHIYPDTLFCDLVYLDDPLRSTEVEWREGKLVRADKTWAVLKSILESEKAGCKASNVQLSQVYFADDLVHPDLQLALPKGHYLQVKPYEYNPSFDRVAMLFLRALREAGFFSDDSLKATVNSVRNLYRNSRPENLIASLKKNLPEDKESLALIQTAIQTLQTGGSRRKRDQKTRQRYRHTRKIKSNSRRR